MKHQYWWKSVKRVVAPFVAKCMICQHVKAKHQRPLGVLQTFVITLPMTFHKHNAMWIIVDQLTKSTHFIRIRTDFSLAKLSKLYIKEVVKLHEIPSALCQIKTHGLIPNSRLPSRRLWVRGRILALLISLKQTGNQKVPFRA